MSTPTPRSDWVDLLLEVGRFLWILVRFLVVLAIFGLVIWFWIDLFIGWFA